LCPLRPRKRPPVARLVPLVACIERQWISRTTKRATIDRRVARRMALHHLDDLAS
jgi:hypothetical protein